jgi:glutamate synthase (NADPH/NADH) small chain
LACAQQLARAGHAVVVYEKNARIGGLLRYGIPDFKLDKRLIDRRMAQMQAEGVEFRTNRHIGISVPAKRLFEKFDAVVLAGGCEQPRDLEVPGRELKRVHLAMDFLIRQNRRVADEPFDDSLDYIAKGKDVVVIGGGDTGSDCVGTSARHKANSITQIELMPKPPEHEDKSLTWPNWPMKMRTSTSHEEGCKRDWSVSTKAFLGSNGEVSAIKLIRLEWEQQDDGAWTMREVPGSEFEIKADMVLLAMGFTNPVQQGLLSQMRVELDPRGNVLANEQDYQSSADRVFAAGDMRRGQSLVVWAIREGRQCARAVDEYLMGGSDLPR